MHPSEQDLCRYLDDELGEAERVAIAAHLQDCPGCLEVLQALGEAEAGELAEALGRLPLIPARFRTLASAPDPAHQAGANLLFGVLALQNDFIDRQQLLDAFGIWVADKARPLARILADRGALDEARRVLLEALVAEHLKRHGGETEASLASVSSLGSVREDLEWLDDTDLRASLAAAGSRPAGSGDDTDTEATAVRTRPSRRAGGRFRVLRFHKQGGLGRIYVAHDEELGREVALKEIRSDKVAEAQFRSRFVLEAEINGGLEHPGIVPVYSLGTYDDGRPFYAMRFVAGGSLKEAVAAYHQEHPRPDPAAVEFRRLLGRFVDICEAIAFAHSRGVLHRDLKPGNVMLGRYGETLLIDWGLAKATGRLEPAGPGSAGEETLVPPSGSGHAPTVGVMGSPPYMSPEQAAGAVESLGPAADVYGLGAILFALLTAEPPLEDGTTDEVLDRARRGAIRRPRALNPNVPRALEAICLKALAREPADRYPSARSLAEDVERWMADEPVSAWREPFSIRARRWARRNRTAVTGAAAAILAGSIGLAAVAAVQSRARSALEAKNRQLGKAQEATNLALDEATRARVRTQEALAQSEEARRQAKAINDFLTEDLLTQAEPAHTAAEDHVTLLEVLDRAAGKVGDRFADQPEVEDALRRTIARTYHGLGSWAKAEEHWRSVLEAARRRLGGESREALTALGELAHILADRGRRGPEVIEMASSAAEGLSRILGPDHPDTLRCRNDLAEDYRNAGRIAEAVALHQATLKQRESKLGPDHPDTLTSRNNLAEAYRAAGRIAEAIPLHEATLKQCESRYGPGHPDTLQSRNNLALTYRAAGRAAEAIALLEVTFKLCESRLGPGHADTLSSRNNLAAAYHAAGRTAEAIPLLEVTLKLYESKLGADHPDTLTGRNNLAAVYLDAGRTAEAVALHEATLRQRESKLGPDHPDTLTSRSNFAEACRAAGRTSEAIALHEATLKQRESKLGPDHPDTLISRGSLAKAYRAAGQLDRAVPLFEQALQGFRAKVGPDHPYTLTSERLLAEAYAADAQYAKAERLLRDALERAVKRFGAADPRTAGPMASLGSNLIQQRKWAEAEPILRACLAIHREAQPDDWSTFNARSLLGGSLLGQKKFAEAEPLILSGYEGMKAREARIPAAARPRLSDAAGSVLQLYEAWGKEDKLAEWRLKLARPPDGPKH